MNFKSIYLLSGHDKYHRISLKCQSHRNICLTLRGIEWTEWKERYKNGFSLTRYKVFSRFDNFLHRDSAEILLPSDWLLKLTTIQMHYSLKLVLLIQPALKLFLFMTQPAHDALQLSSQPLSWSSSWYNQPSSWFSSWSNQLSNWSSSWFNHSWTWFSFWSNQLSSWYSSWFTQPSSLFSSWSSWHSSWFDSFPDSARPQVDTLPNVITPEVETESVCFESDQILQC